MSLAGSEILVRAGIASNAFGLRDPRNYVQPFCNDDYHKLRFLWFPGRRLKRHRFERDPVLGWRPIEADPSGPVDVAFFGDSFMAGVAPTPKGRRIPAIFARLAPEAKVADLAVPGFGVDQIYLRFDRFLARDSLPRIAVVGILMHDLDRSLEHFRAGPKPYFEIEDGRLVLRGTPISQPPEQWSWAMKRTR